MWDRSVACVRAVLAERSLAIGFKSTTDVITGASIEPLQKEGDERHPKISIEKTFYATIVSDNSVDAAYIRGANGMSRFKPVR